MLSSVETIRNIKVKEIEGDAMEEQNGGWATTTVLLISISDLI